MAIKRTFQCDIPGCTCTKVEEMENMGVTGWMQIMGIALNGAANPYICEGHKIIIMDFVDSLKGPPKPFVLGGK